MGKRRRERDRPKAAPDASYNPNKRLLLSYASDEEVQDDLSLAEPANGEESIPTDRELAQYQFDDYDDDDGSYITSDGRGTKPQVSTTSTAPLQEQTRSASRAVQQTNGKQTEQEQNKKNWATNQRPALGYLPEQWEEMQREEAGNEEIDSETRSAMAYLQMVKDERQNLPSIVQAPISPDGMIHGDTDGLDDMPPGEGIVDCGYYEDGMYAVQTGIPDSNVCDLDDPQTVYTKALIARFLAQRKSLSHSENAASEDSSHDQFYYQLPLHNRKARREWHRRVISTTPAAAHIAALEVASVFKVLELIRARCLAPGALVPSAVSAWIWSLLAKLDEVGNMVNDEVFPLRELGKRAILCQLSFTNPAMAAQLAALDTDDAVNDEDEERVESDREDASLENDDSIDLALRKATEADDNTFATFDMILVVVGEIFRQRDLLEHRRSWEGSQA